MRVVQINQVSGFGSTGRIAEDLSRVMTAQGIENAVLYGMGETQHPAAHRFGTPAQQLLHKLTARLSGRHAFASGAATRQMIAFLEEFRPDVVHLHNLHGFYLHIGLLFRWLCEKQIPVVWTLHDCWSFTGHCAHFAYTGCDRWRTGCGRCPQRMAYPKALWDASAANWKAKCQLFTSLKNCTVVTPSRWLAELAKQSFLGAYPVRVIPNGIDLEAFSAEKKQEHTGKMVLASASSLNPADRKGGCFLPELARLLGSEYRVCVLGLQQKKPDEKQLPANLQPLPYVKDKNELAALYAAADVFVNPTLEDTFPTVNLEALACGTPVVTFATGGSPESLDDTCGAVVPQRDMAAMAQQVRIWAQQDCAGACRTRAQLYDKETAFSRYIELYRELAGE